VLFTLGVAGAVRKLLMPWIFLPLGVGMLVVLVLSPFYDSAVDTIDINIRVPLTEFDLFMNEYIYEPINNVTQKVPPMIVGGINDGVGAIVLDISAEVEDIELDAVLVLNQALNGFTTALSNTMQAIGAPPLVSTFTISPQSLSLTNWGRFIPPIPIPDMSSLMIEEDEVSVEIAISPW
jgi:hypothetical protein